MGRNKLGIEVYINNKNKVHGNFIDLHNYNDRIKNYCRVIGYYGRNIYGFHLTKINHNVQQK